MNCAKCGRRPAVTYIKKEGGGLIGLCRECYAEYGKKSAVCPSCGMAFSEFEKTMLLGCAECYTAFREWLMPVIERVQLGTHHTGNAPSIQAEENYDLVRELILEKESLAERLDDAHADKSEIKRIKARISEINRKISGGEEE